MMVDMDKEQIDGVLRFSISLFDCSLAIVLNHKFFERNVLCLSSQISTVKISGREERRKERKEVGGVL